MLTEAQAVCFEKIVVTVVACMLHKHYYYKENWGALLYREPDKSLLTMMYA